MSTLGLDATRVLDLDAIKASLEGVDLVAAMAEAFTAYSQGRAIIPPVGELLLPDGECHIKYGTLKGGPYYVVKAASGFPGASLRDRPTGNGVVLLFDAWTGHPAVVLLDQGYLTDVRTAAAGALCARLLGPKEPACIGVIGTGTQAYLQASQYRDVVATRDLRVWGWSPEKAQDLAERLSGLGYDAEASPSVDALASECDLIVTATMAKSPLLHRRHLRPGMHITAVGSDTPHKQELDAAIIGAADVVAVDSRAQCGLRGEVFQAGERGLFRLDDAVEIGELIQDPARGRIDNDQVTVADLTGVAVQDLMIAAAVCERVSQENDYA